MSLIGDDCRFFMNNECVRGNSCSFRHQPGARETETICPEWIKGACYKTTCVLRHMIDPDRTKVPCYWESQPSGCLKTSCPFLHTKAKPVITMQSTPVTHAVTPAPSHVLVNHMQPRIETAPLPNIVPKIGKTYTHTLLPNGSLPIQDAKVIQSQFHPMIGARAPLGPQIQLQNNRLVIQQPVVHPSVNVIHQNSINQSTVRGATVNTFPKNEHFSRQVELFKKMLAKKNNSTGEDEELSDDYDSSGRYKRKERHKRKSRKHKDVHHSTSKKIKKERNSLSKGDEEILYGDYKNVSLDKRSKENNEDKVTVKPYDEILREKALRKVMAKRKAKFNDDFEELVGETMKRKNRKSTEDKNDVSHNSSLESTIDEEFSKEDAVELDASPIRHDDDFSSPSTPVKKPSHKRENMSNQRRKKSRSKSFEKLGEVSETESYPESTEENTDDNINEENDNENFDDGKKKVLEVASDEAIDFDVDASDDLAVEMRSMNGKTKSSKSKSKKLMSSVVVTKPRMAKSKTSLQSEKRTVRVAAEKLDSNEKDHSNKPKSNNKKTDVNKANVVVIGSAKQNSKTVSSEFSKVKVKTFEEIMAEKKRRKAADCGSQQVDELKEKSKQVRSNLLEESQNRGKTKSTDDDKKLKRQDSNEDAKAKRKSIPLYKPPFNPEGKTEMIETKTVVDTGPRKIIRIKKSIPPVNPSKKTTLPSETNNGSTNSVKSFEEIMNEKRLRKKNVEKSPEQNDQPKTGEKLVRHRFLNKNVAVKTSSDQAKTKPRVKVRPIQNSESAVLKRKPDIARVPPLNTVKDTNELRDVKTSEKSDVPLNAASEEKHVVEAATDGTEQGKSDAANGDISFSTAIENIQEALDEKKRLREKEILSDEEFEKEINDICDGELSDGGGEIDDDDLMMEIEQMIGNS